MKAMRALKLGMISQSRCLRRKLVTILSAVIPREHRNHGVTATMALKRVRKMSEDPRCTGMAIWSIAHPVPGMAT